MPELTPAQLELARLHGIAVEYVDWYGDSVAVAVDTVLAVLASLGVDASTSDAADAALLEYERTRSLQALPTCVVTRRGRPLEVRLRHPDGVPAEAWLELEDGERIDAVVGPTAHTEEQESTAPGLVSAVSLTREAPLGYHRLWVRWPGGGATTELIVTPDFLGLPDRLRNDRAWGLTAQLYSVRSHESWGIGDLTDLRTLVSWSGADLGADFLLVNPLSAAEPRAPMEPSPYLPSSRAFVNPMYLRVEDIPEYGDLPPADRAAVEALAADVHDALDDADTIHRDASWTAKESALRLVHAVRRDTHRDESLAAYRTEEGSPLRDFATWCALFAEHGPDWHEWPEDLRHPDSPAVAQFRDSHADAVDFYSWLQWVLDDQLADAQEAALAAGMRLGVMHDLAVGVHPIGADSWLLQDVLAHGITVGAPPDAFTQLGQDWSQPPWRPDRLAAVAYAPYRRLIARLLRHAGALRVDHIIGLFRLWCIPQGTTPDQGTYLRFDHEALIGILALEAHRADAVVVGEDLGNVEASARAYLVERGIIGTSILWFERDAEGKPLPAERWREFCLASVVTHDLPPTAGYLAGNHVELRAELGLLTRPIDEERAADEADRAAWLALMEQQGLLEPGADVEETVTALHRYLARTPARLLSVALTDAVGDVRTQNQPGTADEYPNWRVPLSGADGAAMSLEDVMSSLRVERLAAAVQSALHLSDVSTTASP